MTRKPKTQTEERLIKMIQEMAVTFCRVTGVEPTREQIRSVEVEIRSHFGGERIYIAAHPKAQIQRKISAMASGLQRDAARSLGISERTLRRALRGK